MLLLQEAQATHDPTGFEAKQVAYMRDPALIPDLERATKEGVSQYFIRTLLTIGTPEAKLALERLTQEPVDWIRNGATTALAMWGRSWGQRVP